MNCGNVSISLLRFFSLIVNISENGIDRIAGSFNLTLEILFVDRCISKPPIVNCGNVSISLLRFFSLIAGAYEVLREAAGFVSISLLRFFSLIGIGAVPCRVLTFCCFNLTLEILFVDRLYDALSRH